MTTKANRILTWITPEEEKLSFIIVREDNGEKDDDDKRWLELCYYSEEDNRWRTEEKIGDIDEIDDFGIPETFID